MIDTQQEDKYFHLQKIEEIRTFKIEFQNLLSLNLSSGDEDFPLGASMFQKPAQEPQPGGGQISRKKSYYKKEGRPPKL